MALAIHTPIRTMAFAVEPPVNSIASFVQFPIISIALTFHLIGQFVSACFPGHICFSVETSLNPVSSSIQLPVDLVALSIQILVNSITLFVQPFSPAVLGHGWGKHCCYQKNTCADNYFFHGDFLLVNELDFRALGLLDA